MDVTFGMVEECAARADAIAEVVRAAFARKYGSGDGEVNLIAQLRADGDVAVELAAMAEGEIIGHVLFSRLAVEPATLKVAALAPVSARVDRQKRGIGSALIREGLSRCKALGFDAVAVLGDADYYKRFGFSVEAAQAFESAYDGPHFQALELRSGALHEGRWKLVYPVAFDRV
ncbi:MAG: GNAT family N-acetyltransferase [Rhizomicrobium sp.]